ncbi:unnamed protein product [Fusarium graminearum]|nr:unnamed protein product [Fusarium graminearum]
MSTPISTAAVVSWRHLDSKKFLAEADPTQQALTFKMRLEERSYFFEIWVPLYLKQRPKKDTLNVLFPYFEYTALDH